MARTTSHSTAGPNVTSRSYSASSRRHLVGQLDSDGIASLELDTSSIENQQPPRSLKGALKAAGKSYDSDTVSTNSEEDYDNLQHDPLTIVSGAHGGGYERENIDVTAWTENTGTEGTKPAPKAENPKRPAPLRLTSIPVTLEKSNQKGKYFLIAEDKELKSILKMGAERQEQATKKLRTKYSDILFTRRFTTFDRQNTESGDSPFHGFFNLFWLGTAIFVLQTAANNYFTSGNIMGTNEMMDMMVQRDLVVLGVSDGVMCLFTGFGWLLQLAAIKAWLSWDGVGWIIQSIWEVLFVAAVVQWTLFRQWPWTHTVFFVLHGIVMLMKQHSYAFYNGYLSEAYKTRKQLEKRLEQLENTAPVQTPSATSPAVTSLSTSYLDHQANATELNQRRQYNQVSAVRDTSTDISQVAKAIDVGEPLDVEQIVLFKKIIRWEIQALSEELQGKASKIEDQYPKNLTFVNHYEYIVLPTLVYELEFPRTDKINWAYVVEKSIATAGILFIMMLVSQSYIYPVVMKTIAMKEAGMSVSERLRIFPSILNDLIFPFMMEYLMAWYIIWECILNLLAELTYFADRGFYADWWNSISWDQFARDWNRPVHNFLLRHVYHSSISTLKVNKMTATLITFFLSSIVHELVMWCIFKRLRGYLLFLQMMQIPLVHLSRSRFLRGHLTGANLFFWVGIFTGPSLLCSLYLII